MFEELVTIFEKSDRMPDVNDLQEMRYLDQCIKETLRLCPSIPVLLRKLGEPIKVGMYYNSSCYQKSLILIKHFNI